MNISAPFIHRPVATTLLTVAVAIAGAIAFTVLPVSPLPQVDFPTINVSTPACPAPARKSWRLRSPRRWSASSATSPASREMTSSSSLGSTGITLQFDLSRNIDGAARDVEAAINAARTYLPTNLPANPSYRKVNPADSPIMILGLTSDKYDVTKLYDRSLDDPGAEAVADSGRGPGQRRRRRHAVGARRGQSHQAGELRPHAGQRAIGAEPAELAGAPRPDLRTAAKPRHHHQRSDLPCRRLQASDRGLSQRRCGSARPMSPTWSTPPRTSAPPATWTA